MGKENQIVYWAIRSIGTIPKKCKPSRDQPPAEQANISPDSGAI